MNPVFILNYLIKRGGGNNSPIDFTKSSLFTIPSNLWFTYFLIFICRYSEDLELEDAIHTAILTLKEGFEGQMTADNIEIGICNEKGFKRLTPSEVKDFLENVH